MKKIFNAYSIPIILGLIAAVISTYLFIHAIGTALFSSANKTIVVIPLCVILLAVGFGATLITYKLNKLKLDAKFAIYTPVVALCYTLIIGSITIDNVEVFQGKPTHHLQNLSQYDPNQNIKRFTVQDYQIHTPFCVSYTIKSGKPIKVPGRSRNEKLTLHYAMPIGQDSTSAMGWLLGHLVLNDEISNMSWEDFLDKNPIKFFAVVDKYDLPNYDKLINTIHQKYNWANTIDKNYFIAVFDRQDIAGKNVIPGIVMASIGFLGLLFAVATLQMK